MKNMPCFDEKAYLFYIDKNVKDNFTDLIVSILEDYAPQSYLVEAPWYQDLFLNDTRAIKIKSFWSVSPELFSLLKETNHLVTHFYGFHLWACEQATFEIALQFLKNPKLTLNKKDE